MGRSREMIAIANAVGVPHGDGDAFEVVIDGTKVLISADTNSGTIVGLALQVPRGALPHVYFRREDDDDRSAKARGINVEAQTGDERFDMRVYIEADLPEPAVQALLSAVEARVAIV